MKKEVGARLGQTQELGAGQMNWPWTETLRRPQRRLNSSAKHLKDAWERTTEGVMGTGQGSTQAQNCSRA